LAGLKQRIATHADGLLKYFSSEIKRNLLGHIQICL